VASESDVEFEAVDAGRLLGKMSEAGNRLNIVILGACRDRPQAAEYSLSSIGSLPATGSFRADTILTRQEKRERQLRN